MKRTRSYWLFLAVTGLAMLWLNLLDVPTLSDDIIYRFMWNTDETAPVQTIGSLADLLHSQWNHYMTTNGRMVVHLLAQAFLVFCPASTGFSSPACPLSCSTCADSQRLRFDHVRSRSPNCYSSRSWSY